MSTFTGTNNSDTIRPNTVSTGVIADPAGSKPSDGADIIDGRGGDDYLNGGGGVDALNGGDGNDTVEHRIWWDNYVDGDVTFTGTASFHGGAGNDTLTSYFEGPGVNLDNMTYRMYGDAGDDHISATYYYSLSETTNYGAAHDFLYGGAGNDSYTVYERTDVVSENPGEGYDSVHVYGDDYTLPANVEKLQLDYIEYDTGTGFHGTGNELDNVIIGSSSSDILDGAGGDDTIYGKSLGAYDEGFDQDTIHGGAGNDTIYGGGGNTDTWDNDDKLYGDAGNDEIFGLFGDDLIYGGAGDDKLWGQSENDTIYGGDGNDRIGGGSGEDHLYGDAGNDVISGTGGRDWLTGGAGNDRFDWDNVTESTPGAANRDVIVDFFGAGAKGGDVIDLSTIDANSGVGGNQAFIFGGAGAGHVHAVASGARTA